MKKLILSFSILLLSLNFTFAQEVSNQDLYKYAIVMEAKDLFADELSSQITEYVEKQDPALKNRYNALASGETPASDVEKKFIGQVNSMKNERTKEFSDAYKTLIKRVLGADTYKNVQQALQNDETKQRYQEIVSQIQAAKE